MANGSFLDQFAGTDVSTADQNSVQSTNLIAYTLRLIYNNLATTSLFGGPLSASYATLFTADAGTPAHIDSIAFTNTTGAAISVSLSLVPPGGTASAANAVFSGNSIPANTTIPWTSKIIVPMGYTVQALASATGLNVNIAGGKSI